MLILISFDGVHYGDLNLTNLPNLKRISDNGLFVNRLETVFPSVTWNIHTSVVTGKNPCEHRIYGNEIYDRKAGKNNNYYKMELGTKEELIKVPTFYDILALENKKTAAICWPLTQGAKNIDINIPEFYTQEEFDNFCSQDFYNELKENGFPVNRYGDWSKKHALGPLQDDLTASIIEYIIKNRRADIILGHFLLYDSLQHEFGVGSPEALWSIRYVDTLIGRIIDCIESENIKDECSLIIFSDHGHTNVTNLFNAKEILNDSDCDTTNLRFAYNGGCVLVYGIGENKIQNLEAAKEVFRKHIGTDKIFDENNMHEAKWSLPEKKDVLFPDFVVALKEGWCGTENNNCEVKSMHGYLPSKVERMNGFLTAMGKGFEKEATVENISITDIYNMVMDICKK